MRNKIRFILSYQAVRLGHGSDSPLAHIRGTEVVLTRLAQHEKHEASLCLRVSWEQSHEPAHGREYGEDHRQAPPAVDARVAAVPWDPSREPRIGPDPVAVA